MKINKLMLISILILTISVVFMACSPSTPTDNAKNNSNKVDDKANADVQSPDKMPQKKIEIITTLFPTYDFAKNIVGDKGNVNLLLNPGIEPHSYEPTPKDIVNIQNSNVFIYTGDNMEPWVAGLLSDSDKFILVDSSKSVELLEHHHDDHEHEKHEHHDDHEHEKHQADEKHEHHDDHEHEKHQADEKHEHHDDHDHHHHGGKDPHIWTDPINAKLMVDNILEGIIAADPENAQYYTQNAQNYKSELDKLHAEFEATLLGKDVDIVYGGHFALGYMAKRYDMDYITAYEHFSPDAEPSAKRIAELKDFVLKNKIKIIYHEEMLSPKIAQVISESTGAKLLELSGIHNVTKEDFEKGIGYIDIMQKNLYNLKEGL